MPRDRDGSFDPQLAKKRQTRFTGFDEKILGMYARGMTVRDIQGHLEELYGVDVSPDLISRVTSAVAEDVVAWAVAKRRYGSIAKGSPTSVYDLGRVTTPTIQRPTK